MIDKRIPTPAEAVAGVKDGDMVLISGFGEAGNPTELIHALIDLGWQCRNYQWQYSDCESTPPAIEFYESALLAVRWIYYSSEI